MDIQNKKESEMKIRNEYLWLALLVAVIAVGPLLSIWALNTLFPVLAIPYTLETWAAMALVGGVFQGLRIGKKD
jgi:hypothetical protein